MATKYVKERTIRALFREQGMQVSPSGINSIDDTVKALIEDIIDRTKGLECRLDADVIMLINHQKD